MHRTLVSLLLLVIVSGCAVMPEALQGEYSETIRPTQVASAPETYRDNSVRWGGVIVEIINNEQETWIEILSLPISESGRPLSERQANMGRFIAKTNQFLDPEVYQKGLRLTVIGTIQEPIKGKVGERDYTYPTVLISNHYLWPNRVRHNHYVYPGYWWYGYHPAWRFGYPFYGYGVWYQHRGFYPYFPVYGYISRNQTRQHYHQYRAGDFSYAAMLDWSERQRRWAFSNIHHQVLFPGHSRNWYRGGMPRMTNQPGQVVQNRQTIRQNRATQPRRAAPPRRSQSKAIKPYTPPQQREK